jgi:uncharacterized repeat protein (TIGR02543 family)
MNPAKKIVRVAILATIFAFVSPVVFAGTVTVPHGTLSATLGAPVGFSCTPDWYVVNDPTHTIGLGLRPYATLGSTMASISCPGSANLAVSQNPGWNTLSLTPGSGTATMNLGLNAGLDIELIAFGYTVPGSLSQSKNWGFTDSKNFSSYLLTSPVTLSGQISQTLVSLNTLDALTLQFGFTIPSWLAGINLNINAVANLDQTIQGANINTSAGAISSDGQSLNVYTSGTSYQLQNVQETWSDSATLSLGLGADMSAELDFLGASFSVQLVDFGNVTLISASQTYQLQSSAISTVSFDLSTGGGSSAPVISTVSPSTMTGLPTGQTQLIRIIGSGFTSASTLTFNDGVNPSYMGRVPSSWSANELDYNISVGTNQANWTVVVNGSQTSNVGHFTVNAPSAAPTGSLVVNLSPTSANSAGAQWLLNGSYHNSGDVVTALTPGQYTVSFKYISGYTTPASFTVNIVANQQTTTNATYSTVAATTYMLTLNYNNAQGGASASPLASGNIYTAGSVLQIYASANTGYHFTGWSGDVGGTGNPVTITMTGNKNVTANFASGDPTLGTVIVTIQPLTAATAGVTWGGFNGNDFRASGSSYTGAPGTYFLSLHTVDGWVGPSTVVALLVAGQTTNVTVTFTQDTTPGLLTVTLSPPDAVTMGAKWHANGGAAQGSGATASLAPGTYTVTFDAVSGWTAPLSQLVTVQRAQTTVVSGDYTPPVGQPVIATIHPSFGALAGGTALTIEGINFTAPASVFIGGKLASSITVLNPSQIACLTPSNLVYGTVPVVVQTATGNATNANGFTYGVERGNGMELVSAIGGETTSAAVQGNYAYLGEGSSFVVADISNPASPSPVGRLAMPGMMQDVAISGQYAFTANNDAGLQVVDVSTPSVPKLVGFYCTPGIAEGVAISGTNAFVVDGTGSFLVFDITIPKSPVLLASTNLGGFAWDVAVSGNFAYVIANGKLVVVDVTNPSSPNVRGQLSIPYYAECLAVSGNRVFVAGLWDGLRIIDVSNPDSPNDLGSAPGVGGPYSVATSGNLVFTAGSKFAVSSYSAGTMTFLGANNSIVSGNYKLAASGNRAYMPAGANGFSIVDASTPSSPTLSGSLSVLSGDYGSTALSSNYLFVMAGSGMKIFNISNPALPLQVAQYNGVGGAQGHVLVTNGIAYLNGDGGETRILNIANPATPSLLSTIPSTVIESVKKALSGNLLLIAGQHPTADMPRLIIVDISNPASPVVRATKDFASLNGAAMAVAITGNEAIVKIVSDTGVGQLQVLNILDVNNPIFVGSITNIGGSGAIAISGDGRFVFVADGSGKTFRVVDISDPSSPVQVANISLASDPVDLSVRGNFVYIAGSVGVLSFDVSNPASPVLASSYSAPGNVLNLGYGITVIKDLAHDSDLMFTGDNAAGLVVLRTKDTEAPSIQITSPTISPSYTNTTSNLDFAGSASDNGGVTRVTWLNDRGGAGDATGTTNWSVTGILLQPGTNIFTATAFDQAGNSSNATLAVIYQTTNQNQTITFPAIADHTFGDAPIPLVAAASSGLPVTFSVISGPATLSSSNVLMLTGAGAVTVEANQSGNGSFNSATPVDMNFNVTRANQSIAFTPIPNHSAGDPNFVLTGTTSSGLPVYFNVISGPAITSSNMVTLLGGGTITVVAWQPGNSNYNAAATVQQSFTVAKVPQTITFGVLSQQKAGDAPFPLTATTDSGLLVSFSLLSGPAQLSGNILSLTGWGTVTVRASQPGNSMYAAAVNVDQALIVLPPNNTIGAAQFTNGGFQLAFYGTEGSNYTLQASTDLVHWASILNFTCTNTPTFAVDTQAKNYSIRFYRITQGTLVIPITLGFNTTQPLSANGFMLTVQGPLGSNYVIQVSTNLINWQPLTIFVSTNATMYFQDTSATNFSRRFYRAITQ